MGLFVCRENYNSENLGRESTLLILIGFTEKMEAGRFNYLYFLRFPVTKHMEFYRENHDRHWFLSNRDKLV